MRADEGHADEGHTNVVNADSAPDTHATAGAAGSAPVPTTLPVSVVVPAYGHADYIVGSIESVLAQVPPPREVIVVDDSSPDDTAERLAPLVREGRIRYVRQPNAGMAAARNAGARLATSEYLYFLDDDDLVFPGALAWLADELERQPEAAFASGDREYFSAEPPALKPGRFEWEAAERLAFVCFNTIASPGQVLIRRRAFADVGGFDQEIWGSDDWDLWLRLLERHRGRLSRRPVLAYRQHANNASRNMLRMYNSSLMVARRALGGLPPAERVFVQRHTYRRLCGYVAPGLAGTIPRAVGRGDWPVAARAARAWAHVWALKCVSYVHYRLHLLLRGHLRIPADHPLRTTLSNQEW
jgi:glycosyltransferase involved in cell wall biosynthesis